MHQRSWVYRSLWNPSNNAPVIALNYFSGFVLDRFNCMVTVDAYSTGASVLVASGLLLAQRERAAHDIQMMNRLLKTPVASALILHPPGYRVAALWVSGINIAEHVCISYAGNRTAHGVWIYESNRCTYTWASSLRDGEQCIFAAIEVRGLHAGHTWCVSYMNLAVHAELCRFNIIRWISRKCLNSPPWERCPRDGHLRQQLHQQT